MTNIDSALLRDASPKPLRWRELWLKEDWWAIWLGLGIVLVAYLFFANGASIKWLAVTPAKWSTLPQLGAHFASNYGRYVAQFIAWLAVFTVALSALGNAIRAEVGSDVVTDSRWFGRRTLTRFIQEVRPKAEVDTTHARSRPKVVRPAS